MKLPLRTENRRDAGRTVVDAAGRVVSFTPCFNGSSAADLAEAKANAEHIVRCVNAHDALVRAVEACLLRFDIADRELGEQLRAALTAAGVTS